MKQYISFWRVVLGTAVVLSLSALYRVIQAMQMLNISITQMNWVILIGLCILFTLLEFFLLGLTWSKRFQAVLGKFADYELKNPAARIAAFILFVFWMGFYSWLSMYSPIRGFLMGEAGGNVVVLGPQNGTLKIIDVVNGVVQSTRPYTDPLINTGLQWWLFLVCSVSGGLILKATRKSLSIVQTSLTAVLGQAIVFKILSYIPAISNFPFSTVWSEGSRWYYASLFFSNRMYGSTIAPSLIDIPLNLLNSIPFLFGNPSIVICRIWSVLLSLLTTLVAVFILVRRLKISDQWTRWLLTAWCFLFLFQESSIYPHLLLAAIAVFAGTSAKKPWLSVVIIFLSSFWVGMDRVNWYPVPGFLAIAFYLLEEPIRERRNPVQYLQQPIIWLVTGIGAAILGGFTRIWVTGAGLQASDSAFTSALLWYRLLPNATYRFGILPAILFVSLPVWLLIGLGFRKSTWHPIRLMGLAGIVFILFAGGLVSSIKIGEGSDLHNLDAYLLILMIIGSYVYSLRFIPDSATPSKTIPIPIICLLLLIPAVVVLQTVQLSTPYNSKFVGNIVKTLDTYASEAATRGNVLFISQRQLLTFGDVKSVPLTPDYEIVTLMEMVMSNNQPYLDKFHGDLRDHRFSLIVVEPQNLRIEGSNSAFGEENDGWVEQVSRPLLCSYEFVTTLPIAGIQLYVPRANQAACP